MTIGNTTNITPPRVSLIDERTGAVSREWYRWFYSLFTTLGSGTGIIPVDSGGTGLGTIPTNGQLLIGNGSGYTLNTLGTGAGISVVNSAGTITIANTGVLSNIAGTGISVSSNTGDVLISNTGVLSWSGGSTGLTPATATTGAVTLGGLLAIGYGTATPTAGAVPYGTGTAYAFTAAGTAGQVLTSAGAGVPIWTTNASGDVSGPASSTDNAIARFDGTTGKLIQNSVTTIDDTGNASGILSQQFSNGSAVTLAAGKMWYDGSTGAWNLGMGNGNITQQVGEELFVYGKASAAITDSPLQIVYHTGTVGASGVITFAPTIAGITDVNAIVGVATEPLALNGFGRVTSFGVVRGITTNGTAFGEVWADDDLIWYNPVTGNPTKVEPVAPYIKVQVGLVIKAGAGGSGSFQVGIARGSKLGGTDSNVKFGTLANNDLIAYDSTAGYWKNIPGTTFGTGTVTSVALALPSILTVSGSPITTSGTLTGTLTTQAVNSIFAGPSSGSSAAPTFRALATADIPSLSYVSSVGATAPITSTGGLTPTIGVTAAALAKTDDTNVTMTLSGAPTTALLAATTMALGWTGQLAVSRGGTGAALTTANFVFAGPTSGAPAAPTFRALTTADISSLGYVTSVSGTTGRITSTGGTTPVIDLASGVITAGTTGSITAIPVITVDTYGRVTSITTAANPQGTVTSVGLSLPSIMAVTNSPVTSSGTLTGTLTTQAVNSIFAGPSSGSAAAPTFRALTTADIPTLSYGLVTSVSVVSANGFAGTVATATTTPAITLSTSITGLLKGNGTAISAAVANTDYVPLSTVITKTADYTITGTDTWIINNKTGSALTLTFPAASSWTGRYITVKNMQAQAVNSASSNIVPIDSTTAGTAILLGVVGNWATMVSDGTNWIIMQAASNNNLLLE